MFVFGAYTVPKLGNTQTFALTSVGRDGFCHSVANPSSMQSFYTVVSKP